MRIMSLDIGDKRMGVAISDRTHIIAQGLTTIKRNGLDKDIKKLKELIEVNEINLIVAGLPLNIDGTLSKKAHEILELIGLFKKRLKIPIETYDERLSSKEAEDILIEGDVSRKKRRDKIDKLAAQIILQNYLNFKKG